MSSIAELYEHSPSFDEDARVGIEPRHQSRGHRGLCAALLERRQQFVSRRFRIDTVVERLLPRENSPPLPR